MAHRSSVLILLASIFLSLSYLNSYAHNPHDPINAFALSPVYSTDRTLFIGMRPGISKDREDCLRSDNGGLSWINLPSGMDNNSDFTSASISPLYQNDGIVFFTTNGNGVYRSTNGGNSWTRVNNGLPTLQISSSAVAVSSTNQPVCYVAGIEGGLYRTEDQGETWDAVISPETRIKHMALSFDFEIDSTLLIVDHRNEIHSSIDAGDSWRDHGIIPELGGIIKVSLLPDKEPGSSNEIFVASQYGVYYSDDFGVNFVSRNNGLPNEIITTLAVSPNYSDDSTLFCTSKTKGVFRSTDCGMTWRHFEDGVPFTGHSPDDKRYHDLFISKDYSRDGTIFLTTFTGLFQSADRGESWIELETRTKLITGLTISPLFGTDATLAVSLYAGGGVCISRDGGITWSIFNKGIKKGSAGRITNYDIRFTPNASTRPVLISNRHDYLLQSSDYGENWNEIKVQPFTSAVTYPTFLAVSPDFDNDRTVFMGTRHDGLLRTSDNGQTWTPFLSDFTAIYSVVLSPQYPDDRTLFVSDTMGRIAASIDRGDTWEIISEDLPAMNLPHNIRIIWLAISPDFGSDQTMLAGSSSGLFCSHDGGGQWFQVDLESDIGSGIIQHTSFSPSYARDGLIYTTVRGSGLYISQDHGDSWGKTGKQLLNDGIQFSEIQFSPEFETDSTLFGVMRSSVYRSTDRGISWSCILDLSTVSPNRAPVLNPIGNKTIQAGKQLTFSVSATDPDNDQLSFRAANLPTGASFDDITGRFDWTPNSESTGTYNNINFTVYDDGTPPMSDTQDVTIIVTATKADGNEKRHVGNRTGPCFISSCSL